MSHSNEGQSVLTPTIQYRYIVECKERTVELDVDEQDVLRNADDEIDCPLDVVLRKNSYSFNDLMSWDAREVRFVEIRNNEERILNKVTLNVNL